MQPLRNCNGPTIRIGREILCLPYAGFLGSLILVEKDSLKEKCVFECMLKRFFEPGISH